MELLSIMAMWAGVTACPTNDAGMMMNGNCTSLHATNDSSLRLIHHAVVRDSDETHRAEKAAVAANDTRAEIDSPSLGLTPSEIERFKVNTGVCSCPGSNKVQGMDGSCAIVGANNILIGASHIFQDKAGNLREGPKQKCTFTNQADNPSSVQLNISRASFGTRRYGQAASKDYAAVKMAGSIVGAEAFPLSDSPELNRGQLLLVVSGIQKRMRKGANGRLPDGNKPIGQVCPVAGLDQQSFLGDCSATKGASGSVAFIKGSNGAFVPAGVLVKDYPESHDGMPFGDDSNGAGFVRINEQVVKDVMKLNAAESAQN